MAGPSDHDHHDAFSNPVPPVVRRLPHDVANSAPATRARFDYQDECIALVMLQHLGADDLQGILVEHSTDAILITKDGLPELVSIKHREAHQADDSGWSWNALKKQRVLHDLYRQWCNASRSCSLAFWTNAGFVSSARELGRVLAENAEPSPQLVRRIAEEITASLDEARAFLAALTTPPEPLPRRKEITAQGIWRTQLLLRNYRQDAARYAEQCYRTLVEQIATASTDVPDEGKRIPLPLASTLAAFKVNREAGQISERYFDAVETLDLLLRTFDAQSARGGLPGLSAYVWTSDPYFVGRTEQLARLEQLLCPSSPRDVAPVVIHGLTGCGKTSLATEFAASHSDVFKPVFINAQTRTTLIRDLTKIAGLQCSETWESGISAAYGPVTPALPGNSRMLLILDGVTDVDTIRGIIPRRSLCRVLITSTVRHLDQGYAHIELDTWRPDESKQYLSLALPDASDDDRERLGRALYHHPLGLVQATNYCRLFECPAPDFLERLAREPLNVLDIGEASGHKTSLMQAITLNFTSVSERNPTAGNLLSLLAHFGSDPVPLSLFGSRELVAYLAPRNSAWCETAQAQTTKRKRKIWQKRSKSGLSQPRAPDLNDADARAISTSFGNSGSREKAIQELLKHSLVKMRDGGLVLNPLIAFVVRKLSPNLRCWLGIAYGLFIEGGEIRSVEDDYSDVLLGHVATLTVTALENNLDGPVVILSCLHLARRLAVLGQISQTSEDEPDATYFGHMAVELANNAAKSITNYRIMAIRAREALAAIYAWSGKTDQAIACCEENLSICMSFNLLESYLRSLQLLTEFACLRGRREIIEKILDRLSRDLRDIRVDTRHRVAIANVEVMALEFLGRFEEAISINQWALEQVESREDFPGIALKLIYRNGSRLARNTDDFESRMRYQLALLNLERSAQTPDRRPDRNLIEVLLGSADAAIDASDLSLSRQLIDEATTLAVDEFGTQSDVYATVLATRGRLFLHLGKLNESRRDLEESSGFYRKNPELPRELLPAVLIHLAHVVFAQGDKQNALKFAREAHDIDRQKYGIDHIETIRDAQVIQDIMGNVKW